jgi:hypothetical protein
MTEKQFFNIFSSNSWFMIPKIVLQTLGLAEGTVLCYMFDIAKYHKTITFYMDNEESIAKRIGLPSRKVLSSIMQRLEGKGLISRVRKGIPCRFYYTLNITKILEIFNKDMSLEEQQDVSVVPTGNNCWSLEDTTVSSTGVQLSKQTKKQTEKQTNTNEAVASKVFINFIGEEFIPNYPKVVPVKRIWSQVTELTKELNTYSVEQYEELCGKIRKHLPIYVKSTEKKYLLAPDNYIAARKWEEDISAPVNKSANNGGMNDLAKDEFLQFLKSKGL